MSRFLLIDIGAGTMDLLFYNTDTGIHYKAVVKSPVIRLAEKAMSIPGDLLVTGSEMGGGPISDVLKERARRCEVIMSASAAATIHHSTERVESQGIRIIDDRDAERLKEGGKYNVLKVNDLEVERLEELINGLGVPFLFDVVGICAQDHGVPPQGVSHLDYRHQGFKSRLDQNPFPHALLYKDDEVPSSMNRLLSIARDARKLPADEIYVMDSGMAAILGASMDPRARGKQKMMVLDVATSHTVGAALEGEKIAGFFEYHTRDITLERLESLMVELADGQLEHGEILKEGGHGAYIRKGIGFQAMDIIVATGPKRGILKNSSLPVILGAPLGDNMMTGTVGILESIRRRLGLNRISYRA